MKSHLRVTGSNNLHGLHLLLNYQNSFSDNTTEFSLLNTAPSLSPLPKHFSNNVLHTFTGKQVKQSHYGPGQAQRAAGG